MKEKLISVIIPMYNSAQYISETIESILSQKDIGYEVIIINDGSTDNSAEICKQYLSENVKLINQENSGAPTARNRGIENAIGKYLLFLDSDDLLCDGLFESLQNFMYDEYNCIIGNFIRMERRGDIEDISYSTRTDLIYYYSLPPYPCNKLYNREIINKYSIRFDNVRITQDLNFYYKFLGVADVDKVTTINCFFSKYRWVEGSISHSVSKKILDITKSIDGCIGFYNLHKANNRLKYLYLVSMKHVCYQIEKTARFADVEEGKKVYAELIDYWNCLRKKTAVFVNIKYFIKKSKAAAQFYYTIFLVNRALYRRRSNG